MNNGFLTGSICLTNIPKELIKNVNGKMYLNIAIFNRKEVDTYGNTHYITCAPKKEERVENVNYFIGDLKYRSNEQTSAKPSAEDIASAPSLTEEDMNRLPF